MTENTHSDGATSESTRPADSPPDESRRVIDINTGTLTLPVDVTPEEAAAIAVSLGAHIRDQHAAAEAAETGETWDGKRFAFAGRIEGLTGIPRRIPRDAPTDEWTAAGRLDRV